MDLPDELMVLLKHAEIEDKKLTWDIQVNSNCTTVKLRWIKAEKAEKPVAKTGQAAGLALKSKHISPSTRKRNARRLAEWKKRSYPVVTINTCAETQTDDNCTSTNTETQTERNDDDQATQPSTSRQRERSTQTNGEIKGRQLTPTKYLITDEEEYVKPWAKCTTVRSPYLKGKLSYKTLYQDGSIDYSESFDPDDINFMDRYPMHTTDNFLDLGDRPPTPTKSRDQHGEKKSSRKKKKTCPH